MLRENHVPISLYKIIPVLNKNRGLYELFEDAASSYLSFEFEERMDAVLLLPDKEAFHDLLDRLDVFVSKQNNDNLRKILGRYLYLKHDPLDKITYLVDVLIKELTELVKCQTNKVGTLLNIDEMTVENARKIFKKIPADFQDAVEKGAVLGSEIRTTLLPQLGNMLRCFQGVKKVCCHNGR